MNDQLFQLLLVSIGGDKLAIIGLLLLLAWSAGLLGGVGGGRVVAVPQPVPAPTPTGPADPASPTSPPSPPVDTGAQRFAACVALVLGYEGGNDDDPNDPGGRTSRGIIQTEWNAWRQTHPGLPADVWQAPQDQVLAIYQQNYWQALSCDDLAPGVDMVVFDYGVNSGNSRSAKLLQQLVGSDVDGEIGPNTTSAAAKITDTAGLINKFCDARLAFLKGLGTWSYFGKGWSSRVADVRKQALAMAAASPAVSPAPGGEIRPSQPPTSPAGDPAWLVKARTYNGLKWSGGAMPSTIQGWMDNVGKTFPEMQAECAMLKGMGANGWWPWCGGFVQAMLSYSNIPGPFGPTETDKWPWAFAWATWGTDAMDNPQPGDVCVFRWSGGGGHVTFYDHEVDDNYYHCTGGDQGDPLQVSTEAMPMKNCIAIRRPPAPGA